MLLSSLEFFWCTAEVHTLNHCNSKTDATLGDTVSALSHSISFQDDIAIKTGGSTTYPYLQTQKHNAPPAL